MYYEFEITVPVTATKEAPIKLDCMLKYGILRKVFMSYPAGVHRVTKLFIYRWERQIFPANPDSLITSDDFTVIFEEYLPIIEIPYNLTIFGYNEGGSYEHTIRCGFTLLPIKASGVYPAAEMAQEELKELLGEYELVGVT